MKLNKYFISSINFLLGMSALTVKLLMPRFVFRLTLFILGRSLGSYVVSVYGVKMSKNWNDATFRYCVSGLYGFYFSRFLKRYPQKFSFIDIGANQGLYSLIASTNTKVNRIYAFEPNPFIRDMLVINSKLNMANLEVFVDAVSNRNGTENFSFDSSHSGIGSIGGKGTSLIEVSVRDYTVFDEIEENDDFEKIVKIDVEGFEPLVIESLLKSKVMNSINYLFFEADEDIYDVGATCEMLLASGFVQIYKDGYGSHYNLMFQNLKIK